MVGRFLGKNGENSQAQKSIGRSAVTFDELVTILTEIESLINVRLITYVYDDQESLSYALSPSHLIYDRMITTMQTAANLRSLVQSAHLLKEQNIKEMFFSSLASNGDKIICLIFMGTPP